VVTSDLTLSRISFKPFFTDTRFAAFSTGRFGGRFQLQGQGRSLAEVLGASGGHITLVMSGGTVSKLIVDAAGLDFGKAAPALLGSDESTDIRCAIGDFGVKGGRLDSNIFVFDTTSSNIDGRANVDLKDETMNAVIEAHPKSASLAAHTPIIIDGRLSHPSVGVDPKELAARGGAAAALSLLTPLVGIIPFIELGLGKDSDCRDLIDRARHDAGTQAPGES
jgi:uncharacterized protein involved in outer membrane biogenesis